MARLSLLLLAVLAGCAGGTERRDSTAATAKMRAVPDTTLAVDSTVRVELAVSNTRPAATDTAWHAVTTSTGAEKVDSTTVPPARYMWVRAARGTPAADTTQWVVFGPVSSGASVTDVDVSAGQARTLDVAASTAPSAAVPKSAGWKCCRVRVRVRWVVPTPGATVRINTTVRWRHGIPQVTNHGPDIDWHNLPQLPKLESPIPTDGTPNVSMLCKVEGGDARLSIQNLESAAVDVWVVWKEINLGPARIEAKTTHSLGRTGIGTCEAAEDAIYITRARFAR